MRLSALIPFTAPRINGRWLLAFDFETHLIGPDLCPCGEVHDTLPPAVCMSWATEDLRSDVVTPAEGLAILELALDDPTCHIIGAETAFDVLVSCVYSGDERTEWLGAWVKAYDEGRVHDVLVRQKELNLAVGRLDWHRHSDGRSVRIGKDLSRACLDLLGEALDKSEDTWRLRYAELDGIPIAQWPAEAVEYSRLDAVATMQCFLAQENWRTHRLYRDIPEIWSGHRIMPEGLEPDPLADAHAQNCHALWLKMMSAEGIWIDGPALEKFERRTLAEYIDLCVECRGHGLLRREYWRDLKRLRELKSDFARNVDWRELKAYLDVDDPEALACWDELKAQGLVRWRHARNMKIARKRMFAVFTMAGREPPRTDAWDKAQKLFAKGLGPAPAIDSCIALDADACRLGGLLEKELDLEQLQLQDYADLTHTSNVINTDIPKLRKGVDSPIHTHFDSLKASGRTGSSDPPIQNRARGEKDRAGDRECFIPDPNPDPETGEEWVMIDIDYPQLELFGHAQNCKWLLGYSTLGASLNRGEDPHTAFAAKILGAKEARDVSYAEAESLYKSKKIDGERDAAKGTNFGRLGALGAKTMVGYAARAYKVVLPESGKAEGKLGWKELFELWDEQWEEMPDYRALVSSWETFQDSGEYCVAQCWSGRLRAGCTYTSGCNTPFQGLGADVAKLAGWYLFKACYVRGVDDELFGCVPIHFIHDQFLIAAIASRANAAARRVEYWCRKAAIEVLPDYGEAMAKKIEALLTERWSKQAKRIANDDGSLEVWEDARLFAVG